MKPRGILPTYVSDTQVVLCKSAPTIRNTYEVRLALLMAVQSGRSFALVVAPGAQVDQSLASHIQQFGGEVVCAALQEHSVFVGALNDEGEEGDGWVAGSCRLWDAVLAGLSSPWLRERLRVGGTIPSHEMSQFHCVLEAEAIDTSNVDDENIRQALLQLAAESIQVGGSIFVQ